MTNGLANYYHSGESIFIIGGIRYDFISLFHVFMIANRKAKDGMSRSGASHLGLYCLPLSHKKDTRLIC